MQSHQHSVRQAGRASQRVRRVVLQDEGGRQGEAGQDGEAQVALLDVEHPQDTCDSYPLVGVHDVQDRMELEVVAALVADTEGRIDPLRNPLDPMPDDIQGLHAAASWAGNQVVHHALKDLLEAASADSQAL